MIELRENPKTQEVYAYSRMSDVIYGIDGTPFGIEPKEVTNWERVDLRALPSVKDWQSDPGWYSTAFCVQARLTKDGKGFTAGGNILCIQNYAEDHGYDVVLTACFRDRNRARAGMQVEW